MLAVVIAALGGLETGTAPVLFSKPRLGVNSVPSRSGQSKVKVTSSPYGGLATTRLGAVKGRTIYSTRDKLYITAT